jgi:Spy/CpxP family protein refolding chaperone
MKTPLLSLFFIGAALTAIPLQTVAADDSATSGQGSSSSGPTNSGGNDAQGQRFERLKPALAELGLTDAQKEQIQQIRASVTDRKERRQEILSVLTPDQKAKLREVIQERRNAAQPGAGASAAPSAN